jgi:putative Ca2+/H+ antiporter (TMEM165/GDT1 family)
MPLAAFISSIGLVIATEFGDKTMLTTMCLSAQYRRPYTVLAATMIALGISSAIAVIIGFILAAAIPIDLIIYISGGLFLVLGFYSLLKPDTEEIESCEDPKTFLGMISVVLFSELGDKSQLAILALAAQSIYPILVFLGAILGFLFVNIIGAIAGNGISNKISINTVRKITGLVFIFFGVLILLRII